MLGSPACAMLPEKEGSLRRQKHKNFGIQNKVRYTSLIMSDKKLKLTFCGGTGVVTGSNFLLETASGSPDEAPKRILVDCGLTQSEKLADDMNWQPFPYDPKTIDALFITHAHVDHVGRIPKLIAEGFRGTIYSTPPTKDIARLMLEDTASILGRDTEHHLDQIYKKENIDGAFSKWETIEYEKPFDYAPFTVTLKDAGHILGSAMMHILYNGKKILFTGDLGNSPSPLLEDTAKITDVDYLIMESVYGDRNHEDRDVRKKILEETIEDNYKAKGTLIVPTFSLERSQELLFEINDLLSHDRIPKMPIFLDSPLAIKLTAIFKKYPLYFKKDVQSLIASGDDIFSFPGLQVTLETQESKMIPNTPDPKIIIAGSGMSNGGRIVHHEHNYLPNPNNTLLLTGYQSAGTMGRLIQEGAKSVRIQGQDVAVKARVVTIGGYSGHKDSDALVNFVEDTAETVAHVYVVMGEPASSMFLVQRLRDNLGIGASAPALGDAVELAC